MPMMLQDLIDQVQAPPGVGVPPPGTPPPGLLAQLMQLGSVDQRHKLLQGQFDQAGQTAAGAPVDYSKGKGAPLALAGLVNLVSAGLGGYQQGKAAGGLRDLVKEQDTGRTAAAQAVQAAPMSDLQSALMASPTDAPAKLQAAQDATGQRSKLGMLLGMTGDPQLAGAGKSLASEAGQDRETMFGIPMARAGLAGADIKNQEGQVGLQAALEKVRKAKADQDALENPATVAAYRKSINTMLPGVDLSNVPASALPHIALIAEKAAAIPKVVSVAPGSDVVDAHTGKKLSSGNASTSLLSPEALDKAADLFNTTGQLPSVGQGAAGAAVRRQIINRSAELHADSSLAGNKAGYKADSSSLAGAQKQADSIESFENTALKNLDNFLATAKNISDTGIPIANKPIRSIAESLGGSPAQAQFNTARQVAIQEISKVLGGAVGGGAISDSQRHEVEGLMRGDATIEQLQAVAQTLKQDMANRKSAVASQIATIRGRISGQPAAPETPAAASAVVAPPQKSTPAAHPLDAAAVHWAKTHPDDARSAAILKANGL